MGHIRTGRLPLTRRWQEVVELLASSPMDIAAVARTTVEAAEVRLRTLASDASLTHSFWLLTRITWAARSPAFATALTDLGLDPQRSPTAVTFIAQVSDRIRSEFKRHPESGPFSELASLALRRTLAESVGQEGRSLFASSVEDLRAAFRRYSSAEQFGVLAKRFFGDLLARTLRLFVDRELSNHVGPGKSLPTIQASQEFTAALDLYARQSARIMERYGADWYSKYNWQSQGEISQQEAQRFVAYSLRKIRRQIRRGDA